MWRRVLHTFYGTFGLSRQSQESGMVLDTAGRHVYFYTKAGTEKTAAPNQDAGAALRSQNDDLKLEDPSILKELLPKGPNQCDLVWTYFGFADDDEATTRARLFQTNLAGSAGMISVEDAAVCEMMQRAMADGQEGESSIEMGGKELDSGGASKLSERALRNFWHNYRLDMGL